MYLVIIIIINFEEDIQRSFQELRLDVNSPELELELELKCLELELELELKLIVSSGIGIGIGIENNGIGIGIELKKRNWPQPCTKYMHIYQYNPMRDGVTLYRRLSLADPTSSLGMASEEA